MNSLDKQYSTKFTYFTFFSPQGKGVACLALERDDNEDGSRTYHVGFSFCSPKDRKNFRKRIARTMAEGRCTLAGTVPLSLSFKPDAKEPKLFDVYNSAILAAVKANKAPGWARRAVARGEWTQGLQ